jgi:ribonuclease P protein component
LTAFVAAGYLYNLAFALKSDWGVVLFETHLSTEPKATSQNAWVPCTYEYSGWSQRVEAPATEEPSSPDSIRACLTSQAFPKSARLLRRREFRRVYDEGARRSASLCTVFWRANGLPQSRLGITAPARLGNAVLRNRLKRRVREVFRRHFATLPGGWDILVNPREPVAKVPFRALERELLRLFPSQPPPAKHGEQA